MGISQGIRAHLVNAPDSAVRALDLPEIEIETRLGGHFGYIHLFALSQQELDGSLPKLQGHLREGGALWVSWPKGRKLGSDLNLREVIRIGYSHGLLESTTLAVDATWSAMKFARPIRGKVYNNSHGQLPD